MPESLVADHGAVSEPVARKMAEGLMAGAGADYGLSITGVAGPGGGTDEKPVGLVWLGLARAGETVAEKLDLSAWSRSREANPGAECQPGVRPAKAAIKASKIKLKNLSCRIRAGVVNSSL